MNKREFVLASGAALLAGAAGPAAARDAIRGSSLGAWQGCVGDTFELVGHHGPGQVLLQRVDSRGADASVEQFTLVFEAPGAALPAGTHLLRHRGRGMLALYLDHAGVDDTGVALLRADCCRLT